MSLITVDEYKAFKSITSTTKDDTYTVIVDSVNELIKAYCDRTFIDYYDVVKTVTVTPSVGVKTLILKEIPIRELVSITEDDIDISEDVATNLEYGFVNYEFTGDLPVVIEYKGGSEITPADIKLAALELVDFYVNDEHKMKRSFGGSSIEYHESSLNWPIHIQYILNAHRDV